ncbi:MAG: GNAT family N-acetyltransferase [Armatimonadetes bacterium]|nr:GNAT family N-acetyltransferase [Armatimonadota bacterium]
MTVYAIDPLSDSRWSELLERHPDASVFHTPNWLHALQRTYGYEPVVFTTSAPNEEMADGIVFCRVNSWLTGKRLVSLPFSDHCQPLVDSPEELQSLLEEAKSSIEKCGQKYLEVRPIDLKYAEHADLGRTEKFYFHSIDLTDSLDEISARLHTSHVKRKLKRADSENLIYSEGRDDRHLGMFYKLLLVTRQRHQIPPQPKHWFGNVLSCLGDFAKIRVALKDGEPVASILTLAYKNAHYYKYGCSDLRFSKMGGTQMLLWRAIAEAKGAGADFFDMGRSDPENTGLVEFKERWGAQRKEICYYRYPSTTKTGDGSAMKLAQSVFRRIPAGLQETIGNVLYKHIG